MFKFSMMFFLVHISHKFIFLYNVRKEKTNYYWRTLRNTSELFANEARYVDKLNTLRWRS